MGVAIVTGKIGGDWMRVHGIAGLRIAGLLVFRLVWAFIGSTYARFSSFVPTLSDVRRYVQGRWRGAGHNPLGTLSVLALLGLLALQVGTGLFSNDDIAFSGPWASVVSDSLSAWLTGWHKRIANGLLVLIGLHLIAIGFYAWFKQENLVKPMVTGDKHLACGEPTRRGGRLSLAIALMAVLAAAYLASGTALPQAPPAAAPVAGQKASPGW
ncbi:MAG: cytochrome b/b6 domain-containing protein [Rhizobacter sp.]